VPEPDAPWLVVVDMQRVFADPDSPWRLASFAGIVPAVNRLVDHFGDRVVFTRLVAPEQPWGSWREYYRQWDFALTPRAAPLWELVPAVRRDGARVVDAPTMSKWSDPLRAVLGGCLHLVLCGVSTDCCLLSTALAAADAGAYVQVAADACAGLTRADHDRAVQAMSLYAPQIRITDVAALTGPRPAASGHRE
jgi:nicotinamidase-related amidase